MKPDTTRVAPEARQVLDGFQGCLIHHGAREALIRYRRLRDGLSAPWPGPPGLSAEVASAASTVLELSSSTGDRDLQRRLELQRAIAAYLLVEASPEVRAAHRTLVSRVEAGVRDGSLAKGLLALVRARNASAQRRHRATTWLELLLEVAGVAGPELDRIHDELVEVLQRPRTRELLEGKAPVEEPLPVVPRALGEFLSRVGLGAFHDRVVLEPCDLEVGAECLPIAAEQDVRILAQEETGRIPARATLRALGACLHDLRPQARTFAWLLPEVSPLRGALGHCLARLADRAGWQLAYGDFTYDQVHGAEGRALQRAAQHVRRWHALSRWEGCLYQAVDLPGSGDPGELLEAILPGEPLARAAGALLARPVTLTWIEILVGENLLSTVQRQRRSQVDDPRLGPLLERLLGHPPHQPWEVVLELVRQEPLTGTSAFPRRMGP